VISTTIVCGFAAATAEMSSFCCPARCFLRHRREVRDVAIVFAIVAVEGGIRGLSAAGRQNELISAVAAANPHTIVVLIT